MTHSLNSWQSFTVFEDNPDDKSLFDAPFEDQIKSFLNYQRSLVINIFSDVTEEEARIRVVPSKTTLLGILKHLIFVEKVWFQESTTGLSRENLGIQEGPDESFTLDESDSIQTLLQQYIETINTSNSIADRMSHNDVVEGNRRGPLTLRWIYLHLLREISHHVGHADIVKEIIKAKK